MRRWTTGSRWDVIKPFQHVFGTTCSRREHPLIQSFMTDTALKGTQWRGEHEHTGLRRQSGAA